MEAPTGGGGVDGQVAAAAPPPPTADGAKTRDVRSRPDVHAASRGDAKTVPKRAGVLAVARTAEQVARDAAFRPHRRKVMQRSNMYGSALASKASDTSAAEPHLPAGVNALRTYPAVPRPVPVVGTPGGKVRVKVYSLVDGRCAYDAFIDPRRATMSDLRDAAVLRAGGSTGYPANFFMMVNQEVFIDEGLDKTAAEAGVGGPGRVVYVVDKRYMPPSVLESKAKRLAQAARGEPEEAPQVSRVRGDLGGVAAALVGTAANGEELRGLLQARALAAKGRGKAPERETEGDSVSTDRS